MDTVEPLLNSFFTPVLFLLLRAEKKMFEADSLQNEIKVSSNNIYVESKFTFNCLRAQNFLMLLGALKLKLKCLCPHQFIFIIKAREDFLGSS